MSVDIDVELFKQPSKLFTDHLLIRGNDRIILSGKFGTGKTSFLKHFFTEKGRTKIGNIQYEVFHLFPVNYSIASTEDILELIKYDITLELLRKSDHISVYQNNIDTTISFVGNHYDKFVELILAAIPKINPFLSLVDLQEIAKKLFAIRDHYKAHVSSENATVNEGNSLVEFMDMVSSKIGGLYESNIVTQIIQTILQRHKDAYEGGDSTKRLENILILDDLDRIDPEHIFRILNVFAAHFDSTLNSSRALKNKFGFDTVVLVCDINNIRKIFSARYGQQVDFTGYVDKFYSKTVFYFELGKYLRDFLYQQLEKRTIWVDTLRTNFRDLLGNSNYSLLIELLVLLYKNDCQNLRKIISLPNDITIQKEFELYGVHRRLYEEKGIVTLMLLIRIMGGMHESKEAFEHLRSINVNLSSYMNDFSHQLFRIHSRSKHKLLGRKEANYIDSDYEKYQPILIKHRSGFNDHDSYEVVKMKDRTTELDRVTFDDEDVYSFILDAVTFLKQVGLTI